jgi:hypothetical protein
MAKELKQLRRNKPDLLSVGRAARERDTRHFAFRGAEDDPITIPVCGHMPVKPSDKPGVIKRQLRGVDCPDCLAALEALASVDSHNEALALAASKLPRLITPDPEKMNESFNGQPTIEAERHILARDFLKARECETPDEIPARVVGSQKATFYTNLLQLGLIDQDGERTEIAVADLVEGKKARRAPSILVEDEA